MTADKKEHKPQAAAAEVADRPGLAARQVAARLLGAVIDAHTPLDGLTDNAHGHPQYLALDLRDRALARAILLSALRFRVTIEAMIARRLERPLPANARSLSHILHCGAAQILFLDVPDSAAVDLAVTQAKVDPRAARFANLVNAVLRSIVRGGPRAREAALHQTREAPDWFAGMLDRDYGPEKASAILAAHRHEAPVDFTVKSEPEEWAGKLGGFVLPTGSVRLQRLPDAVSTLPGYADGAWWVQDAAAAIPARLCAARPGMRVADLCAAPGGKTAQLALTGAEVTAIDLSANRLARLSENLARLSLTAEKINTDLRKYAPDMPFDAVLLDAPCSSTGTVRRHPDVPWTKSPEEIAKLAHLQRNLLDRAIDLTRPGGAIVFSNCSLAKEEGEAVVRDVLATRSDIRLAPVAPSEIPGIDPFIAEEGWIRTTPADWILDRPEISGLDGFFAARMTRLG